MAYTYQAPGIVATSLGALTPLGGGPAPRVVLMLGNAPQGPRYPVLIRAADLASTFGDPTSAGSLGYTLPYAAYLASQQRMGPGSSPPMFLMCRGGVASGSLALLDGAAGTVVTIFGEGKYAGSKSSNLKVSVVGTGASQVVSLIDGPTGITLQVYPATQYNLSSGALIAQAINGANPLNNPASIASVTVGGSASTLAVLTATALSAGTDGQNMAYNDASVATLLSQSLWTHADLVWAGFDALQISTAILAHLNTASSQGELRRAVLGPKLGTLFSTLTGGSYVGAGTFQNSRVTVFGHDSMYGRNPITGVATTLDGFYLAAAMAGIKASGIPAETGVGYPVIGFDRIGVPSDKTAAPSPAEQQQLGANGLAWMKQPYGSSLLAAGDFLTTAPYTVNSGSINPFAQHSIQDADDAILASGLSALQPWLMRPSPGDTASLSHGVNSDVNGLVASLGKKAHNGVNQVTTTLDPTTTAPRTRINYRARWPYGQFNVETGFTIG